MISPLSPLALVIALSFIAVALPQRPDRQLAATALVLLALAAAATVIAPGDGPLTTVIERATRAGVSRPTLLVNAALAGIGLLLFAVAAGRAVVRSAAMTPAPAASALLSWRSPIVLSSVAVLLAPTLWSLAAASALLAAVATPSGRRRSLPLLLALLPLAAVSWFACTVGGTWDVWLTRLADVPFSSVAQRAAVLPLLGAVLFWMAGASGDVASRRRTAWVGVLVMARVAVPLVPDGLDALAPVIWPGVAGLIALAAWRRRPRAAAMAALLLAAAPTTLEPTAAALLVLAAVTLAASEVLTASIVPRRLAWAAAATAAVLLLPQAMRVQVVWTLAVLLLLVAAIWRAPAAAQPRTS